MPPKFHCMRLFVNPRNRSALRLDRPGTKSASYRDNCRWDAFDFINLHIKHCILMWCYFENEYFHNRPVGRNRFGIFSDKLLKKNPASKRDFIMLLIH